MVQSPVSDHQGGPLVGQVDLGGEPEAGTQESGDGGGVAKVGFGDDARTGGAPVEDEVGDGAQQCGAEAAPAVGDAADHQVDPGVVGTGRIVTGQGIEVCPVDLPVAHRRAVQNAEAGDAASVAGELRAQMPLGHRLLSRQIPEGRHGGVVHPAGDEPEITAEVHGREAEVAHGCGDRAPVGEVVKEAAVPRDGGRRGGEGGCSGRMRDRGGTDGATTVRLSLGAEGGELFGQLQVEGVLAVRTGLRATAGSGIRSAVGPGDGAGARVDGRQGDAPLRRGDGRCSSGVKGVGDGDVDGLGVDRADEFIEAVQPGQQIGLAAQDG